MPNDIESEYQRLAELNGRRTPGEWRKTPFSSVVGCPVMAQPDKTKNSVRVAGCTFEPDGDFIASAPAMFDLLTQMREEIARLRESLEDANGMCRSSHHVFNRLAIEYGSIGLGTALGPLADRLHESLARQHKVMHSEHYAARKGDA